MGNDLISRSDTIKRAKAAEIEMGSINGIKAVPMGAVIQFLEIVPAVDAVEVTAQEIQFLIDAMYHHVRWMLAGGLNKPECGYDERVALSEKLRLFEREHFPDMQAETEG